MAETDLYVFEARPAIDPTNRRIIEGIAEGQVFAKTDFAGVSPLTITDTNGLPKTTVRINEWGVLDEFVTTGHPVVLWKSGQWTLVLSSPDGILNAAETAATKASTAAGDAATAAATVAQLKATVEELLAGHFPAPSAGGGNTVQKYWDGTGAQPTRTFPAGHPQANQPVPEWMSIHWISPVKPAGFDALNDLWLAIGPVS